MTEQWNEQSLSEVSGSFWQTCTLQAAVKLDIFSFLGKEEKTALTIAADYHSDLRGMTSLLNALTAMGLLRKSGALLSNTDASSRYLGKQSSHYIGWRILHHNYLMPSW
ncbi:MAG: methyltransferase dimerization domain-containing protein, partial [Acidobacteriota bacterium]